MTFPFCRKHILFYRKLVSVVVALCFSLFAVVSPAGSQAIPISGMGIASSAAFQPPVLRGMSVHPENPLLFDFLVDRGEEKIGNELLRGESTKLIKYFLTSMTIPDKDAWVNLSPTEKDRIIPDALGQTQMGKVMLEQDYVLKQLASSLTNPDKELGQKFWTEVKVRAQKQFGTTDIPLNTFNKVWIVPDGATVVEKDGFAYITESKLTVMLDEDYQAVGAYCNTPLQKNTDSSAVSISTAVFREMILPKLIEEVNTGKNFAATRQVYQSVILAAWYKKALKDSLLGRIYADKSKIAGVETDEKDIKQKVYEQYLEAFKKGAYNVIKEEAGPDGELIPRKYFSGGQIMASRPTVVSSPAAVEAVAGAINSAGNQLALVAASTVETPREAQALISSSGVNLQRPNEQRLAELLKLSPWDPSLENSRLERYELDVLSRPIDIKNPSAGFVADELDKLVDHDPDGIYEVLQVGVGRGVTTIQYALRYPSVRITAVNRFSDEWGWETAIVHAVHEENLRRKTIGQSEVTLGELKDAMSHIQVAVMDIQNADNRREILGNKRFDGVFFEPVVQLYFKDNIRTVEGIFNERVGLNGFMVFDIDPHPEGYDWNLRDPNNRRIELDPIEVVRNSFIKNSQDVVNVDLGGKIFSVRRLNPQGIEIPIKQERAEEENLRDYTRLRRIQAKYVMDPSASAGIVEMASYLEVRKLARSVFEKIKNQDIDWEWWEDGKNSREAEAVFIAIFEELNKLQQQGTVFRSDTVRSLNYAIAEKVILSLIGRVFVSQPVTEAQRVDKSPVQLNAMRVNPNLARFNEIIFHLGFKNPVKPLEAVPDVWGSDEMIRTTNIDSPGIVRINPMIWQRAMNLSSDMLSGVDVFRSFEGQKVSVNITQLKDRLQSFKDLDPSELLKYLELLGFQKSQESLIWEYSVNDLPFFLQNNNIYTMAQMAVTAVRRSLAENFSEGISAVDLQVSWNLRRTPPEGEQKEFTADEVNLATERMLVYLGLNAGQDGLYRYSGSLEQFDQSLKDRGILSASSSVAQKIVNALVIAGVLCSGGCSTVQIGQLNQKVATIVEGNESRFSTDRGPLLAALELYNSSTASKEFKLSIKENIHVLFKQAGYGLVPIYNEFDTSKPVVLFIHGASKEGGAVAFVDALARFHQDANLVAYQFDDSKPLEEIAQKLAAQWQNFKEKSQFDNSRVIVVAHSYGDVVFRQVFKDNRDLFSGVSLVEVAPTLGGSRYALGYKGAVSQAITSFLGFGAISEAQNPNGRIQQDLNTSEAIARFTALNRKIFLVENDPHNPQPNTLEMSPEEKEFAAKFESLKGKAGVFYLTEGNVTHGTAPWASEVLEAIKESIRAASASSTIGDVKTASAPSVEKRSTVGGIDFDPSKLNLQIKRDGRGVPLPLPQQDLENIDIKGLYPVIINILPVNSQTLPILGQINAQPDTAFSRS